jgi:hypothetical protein
MKKYLLSLMAVVVAVTLVGTTTYALEAESIKAENTFDFYENEFDFMMQPAKLAGQDSTLAEGHKLVEGFTGYRLFTNLSNQAGADTYQIGAIIPIPNGMGNVGILFDYRKSEGVGQSLDCVNCGQAYMNDSLGDLNWSGMEDDNISSRYDREWENNFVVTTAAWQDSYYESEDEFRISEDDESRDAEDEAMNFYLAYGLALPNSPVSVGISYTYESVEGGSDSSDSSASADQIVYDAEGVYTQTIPFPIEERRLTESDDSNSSFNSRNSDNEYEYTTHIIDLEGRYNASPLDSLFGFSYTMVDGENNRSNDTLGTSSLDRWDHTRTTDLNAPLTTFTDVVTEVYRGTSSFVSREDDGLFPFCGYGNREGDKWSIYSENIFELTPIVAFGFDIAYNWGTYDDELDWQEFEDDILVSEDDRVVSDQTGIILRDENFEDLETINTKTGDLNGEIDNSELYVRAELRLTYPKVRFGLGVSYDAFQEDGDYDGDWTEVEDEFYFQYFNDTLVTSSSYGRFYTQSGTESFEYELDQETWRFPVSTEFDITDRLVCRLGVEFVYGTWELEMEGSEADNQDESWVKVYLNGTTETNEKEPDNEMSIRRPGNFDLGDADTSIEDWDATDEDTFSHTIYNVGLGYQVTENLDVDAMWRHGEDHQFGESTDREGVSTDTLFVGATLAF